MNVGTLTVEMAANVARLQKDMDAARRTVSKTFGNIERDIDRLKGLLGTVFTGAALTSFVGKLVNVQREFDVLNSSLITVTGSSAAAAKELTWIKDFAATTPYALNEVTSAFVKMKALGLDASMESLRSYGNTASAMGKGLNQMIEAVADAATGEFERLKEFGIRASKEGDRVSLTFRGVTTTIGNSAEEITGYLKRIGEVDFAGAMATRAATLDGALSNLADTWDELFRTISSQNAGGLIFDSVKMATGAIQDLITILGALNGATAENAKQTGAMAAIQNGIATVFETVAVLGVNVKYVLTQIGTEIGGIMAQAAAILRGEFAQAGDIRRQMIADAEAARAQVDATTNRILNARRLLDIAKTGEGMDEPRFARLLNATTEQTKADQKLGTTAAKTAQQVRDLARAEREREKQAEEALKARREAWMKSQQGYLDDLEMQGIELEYQARRQKAAEDWIEEERRIEAEMRAEMLADQERAMQKFREEEQKEYAKHWDQISQGFVDSLMQGGKSVKEYLQGLFRTMVLRPILAPIGAAFSGGASAATGGASGSGGILSSLGSLGSMFGAGGLGGAIGAGAGWLTGAASFGQIMGASGSLLTSGSLAGVMSGAAMSLGAVMPIIGGIMAVSSLLKSFKSPGEQHTGGFFSSTGTGTALGVTGGQEAWARDLTNRMNPEIQTLVESTVGSVISGMTAQAKALGMDIAVGIDAGFAANTNGQGKDKNAFGYFNVTINGETVAEYINRELGTELPAAVSQWTQDMTDAVASFILQGTDFARQGETSSQTLQRLTTDLTAVNSAFDTLGLALYDVSVNGAGAASAFVEMVGGMEQLQALSQSYYQNYYTDAERATILTGQLTDQLGALGLALPGTREEFRAMVESARAAGDDELLANLLKLAPAFAQISETAEAIRERQLESGRKLIDQAIELERERLQAQASVYEEAANSLKSFLDTVRGSVKQLYGESAATRAMAAAQGFAFISQALETARATGYLPETAQLSEAIAGARTGLGNENFRTRFEADRARLRTAAQLSELGDYADQQLTTAEKQLAIARSQLDSLDSIAELLKQQLENGALTVTSIEGVTAIIQKMYDRTFNEGEFGTATGGASAGGSSGGGGGFVVGGGGGFGGGGYATQAERLAADIAAWEAAGKSWTVVNNPSGGVSIVGGGSGELNDLQEKWLKDAGVPGFASGGWHNGGLAMVGEQGPELVYTPPSQVFNAQDTRDMLGGGASSGDMAALRDEVAQLHYAVRAMAVNTAKMARLQDNWDARGLMVKTDPTQPLNVV